MHAYIEFYIDNDCKEPGISDDNDRDLDTKMVEMELFSGTNSAQRNYSQIRIIW